MSRLRWRSIAVVGSLLLFGWYALANFVSPEVRKTSAWLPDQALRLGLDLQGGIHWVLSPDLTVAIAHELDVLRASLQESLAEKKLSTKQITIDGEQLVIEADAPENLAALREAVLATGTDVVKETAADGNVLRFQLTPEWETEVRKRSIDQMLEVIRRRVDDPIQGIPESVVTRQGDERVLVQIPGGQLDREQARALLQKTGFLEFKMILDEAPTEELLTKKYETGLPPETQIVVEKEKDTDRVVGAFLV
ncbi:MAG: hypothetical protein MUF70_17505, partial [Myxococcota bacterium]|nr:hypothetical protein [Myxococcota bacterium]